MSRPTLRRIAALRPRSAVGSIRFTNATTQDRPQASAPKSIKDSTSALECESNYSWARATKRGIERGNMIPEYRAGCLEMGDGGEALGRTSA